LVRYESTVSILDVCQFLSKKERRMVVSLPFFFLFTMKNSDTSQESTLWILEKVAIFIEKPKEDRRSSFGLHDKISVKLHFAKQNGV